MADSPVTAPNPADAVAALAEASGDPAAFRLVYSALMQRYDDSCRVGHMTQFADEVAAHAVQVLRDAGRLLPPDTDTRTEWGTRLAAHGDYAEEFCHSFEGAGITEEERARRRAESWSRRFGAEHVDVMRRTIWTGPWRPVPSTPEETPHAQ